VRIPTLWSLAHALNAGPASPTDGSSAISASWRLSHPGADQLGLRGGDAADDGAAGLAVRAPPEGAGGRGTVPYEVAVTLYLGH